jgi:hypothetical protein
LPQLFNSFFDSGKNQTLQTGIKTDKPHNRALIYLVAPLRCATQSQAALLPEYNPDSVHLVALLLCATHNQAAPLPGLLLTNSQSFIFM